MTASASCASRFLHSAALLAPAFSTAESKYRRSVNRNPGISSSEVDSLEPRGPVGLDLSVIYGLW